jgi:hypothetical protein
VNRDRIAAFSARAAGSIADGFGCNISINDGTPFMAYVTTPQPTMSLETGGFNTDKSIKVRWPFVRNPRPAVGAKLTLFQDNVSFRVETSTSLPGSPLSSEVLVTAIRE